MSGASGGGRGHRFKKGGRTLLDVQAQQVRKARNWDKGGSRKWQRRYFVLFGAQQQQHRTTRRRASVVHLSPPPTAAAAASRTTGSYLPWRSHILASRCTVCARCVWGGAGHAEQQGALRYFMSAQPDAPEMDCLCAGRPYLAEACVKAALFLFLFFEPSSTRMPALQHRNRWMVLGWVAGFRSACMTPCCTHA
jgi:hypothetical protein